MLRCALATLSIYFGLFSIPLRASNADRFQDCYFNEQMIPCSYEFSGDSYKDNAVLRIKWKDGKSNTYRSVPFMKSDNPSTGIPWKSRKDVYKLVELKFGTVWISSQIVKDEQGGRWQLACIGGRPYRGMDCLYNPRNGNVIRYNYSECVPSG